MRLSDITAGQPLDEAVDIQSEAFQRWFAGSKIVDGQGRPLRLFRGLFGPYAEVADRMEGRPGYAAFFTDNPHMASTYATPDPHPNGMGGNGALYPVYIRATVLREFPVKVFDGRRSFDMFAFDDAARRLKKDEAIVVRGVVDCGPRGYISLDPERLSTKPSDIYSVGRGTSVKSAISNTGGFDPDTPVMTEDRT